MKLKYYLRGLGLGILVTALILGLTGNPEMTDSQIRERALELGMVDKTNMTLSEVRTEEATVSTEEASDDVSASASEETGDESVASGEEETEEEDTSAGQEEAGSESISTADEEIKSSVDDESVYEGSEATGEAATAPVTITIVRGDSSVSVSRDLAEAGLVDSAKAFDAYLCGNGYDKRISVGSFQIYPGSTYEEIAKIISRSK